MKSVRQILVETVKKEAASSKIKYGKNEKLPFWFVFDATPDSELIDVMGQYSVNSLMLMSRGGLHSERQEILAFTRVEEARAEAERRIADAKEPE